MITNNRCLNISNEHKLGAQAMAENTAILTLSKDNEFGLKFVYTIFLFLVVHFSVMMFLANI